MIYEWNSLTTPQTEDMDCLPGWPIDNYYFTIKS